MHVYTWIATLCYDALRYYCVLFASKIIRNGKFAFKKRENDALVFFTKKNSKKSSLLLFELTFGLGTWRKFNQFFWDSFFYRVLRKSWDNASSKLSKHWDDSPNNCAIRNFLNILFLINFLHLWLMESWPHLAPANLKHFWVQLIWIWLLSLWPLFLKVSKHFESLKIYPKALIYRLNNFLFTKTEKFNIFA